MAEQITSLTLKINVKSVTEVNKQLDFFCKKSKESAAAINTLGSSTEKNLRFSEKYTQLLVKNIKAIELNSKVLEKQNEELKILSKVISPVNDELYNLLLTQNRLSRNNGSDFFDAHSLKFYDEMIESSQNSLLELIEIQKDFSASNDQMKVTLSSLSDQIKELSEQSQKSKNPLLSFAEYGAEIGALFKNPIASIVGTIAEIGIVVGNDLISYFSKSTTATETLRKAQESLYNVIKINKDGIASFTNEIIKLDKINPKLAQATVEVAKQDANQTLSSLKETLKQYFAKDKVNIFNDMDFIKKNQQNPGGSYKSGSSILDEENRQQVQEEIERRKQKIENEAQILAKKFNTEKQLVLEIYQKIFDILSTKDSVSSSKKLNDLAVFVSDLKFKAGEEDDSLNDLIKLLNGLVVKSHDAVVSLNTLNDYNGNPNPNPNPTNNNINSFNHTPKQNLLESNREVEKSLQIQLLSLKEQNTTVQNITTERKKYLEFQAQIKMLEEETDKSKLTAEERYLLANKLSLSLQYEKNAAIAEEINALNKAQQIKENISETISQYKNSIADKKATFGMSSAESAQYSERIELERRKEKDLDPSNHLTSEDIVSITQDYISAANLLEQRYALDDTQKSDWIMGLKTGLTEFAETSSDVFSAAKGFAQNTMGSMANMMTQLVTTGKANFNEFARSILINIIEIINKLILARVIQTALGWMGFGGGAGKATGGLQDAYSGGEIRGYAMGGNVGYALNPGGFTGRGNKYQPAGIVHKGEFVFTKEATKRIGVNTLYALMNDKKQEYASGGYVDVGQASPIAFTRQSNQSTSAVNVSANIAVNMSSENNSVTTTKNNIDAKAVEAQVGAVIQQRMNEMMKKLVSPGGDLYNVMHAR